MYQHTYVCMSEYMSTYPFRVLNCFIIFQTSKGKCRENVSILKINVFNRHLSRYAVNSINRAEDSNHE